LLPKWLGYAAIGIGAVTICVGAYLLTDYYHLEQWCALNRVPCPNFINIVSIGTFSFILGVILLIAGLMGPLLLKSKQSHVAETTELHEPMKKKTKSNEV
jgi:hypothetical protein